VLNVAGQTRLHEASRVAQSARQRSDVASANRNLLELVALAAKTGPLITQSTTTPNANFMAILQLDHRVRQSTFYTRRRRDLSIDFCISDRGLLDRATGPRRNASGVAPPVRTSFQTARLDFSTSTESLGVFASLAIPIALDRALNRPSTFSTDCSLEIPSTSAISAERRSSAVSYN
jgi:hypothetical protein